jgi:hypothetical protein
VRQAALLTVVFSGALALGLTSAVQARADAPIMLTIKNHHFTPNLIAAPAGQRFTILVRNLDPTPEEFESYDFKVEKIVVPQGTITVLVGPLKPGLYNFFGDYNPTLAKGILRIGAGK